MIQTESKCRDAVRKIFELVLAKAFRDRLILGGIKIIVNENVSEIPISKGRHLEKGVDDMHIGSTLLCAKQQEGANEAFVSW